MRRYLFFVVLSVALATGGSAFAEESLAALKQQLQALQQQVQQLQQKVADLEAASPAPAPAAAACGAAGTPPLFQAGPAYMNLSLIGRAVAGTSTERDVESLQGAHHDPNQRGFTAGAEVLLSGAVDPYFTALAALGLVTEPGGETTVELEEAYLQTTSLPWNLQARIGQFYAEFGRQNTQHPHEWGFVDQAVILRRLFGPDGLRNPGARLAWLVPTPFYTELLLGVFNSDGDAAYSFRGGAGHAHGHGDEEEGSPIHGGEPVERELRSARDLLFVPRLVTSFNLTDQQTLVLGASAAFGPNDSGARATTQIYGVDAYWKWQPQRAQRGFPFVSLQAEALWRRYQAAERLVPQEEEEEEELLPRETLRDWGFYAQALWGFRPGWVLGLRGEYATGNDGAYASELRASRTRISPNLTFLPTEFSKIRLQYNHDRREHLGTDHSVWLQVEFSLGAHGPHKF